ncbi:MAG: hypothetical protein UZ08_BCD001001366 [Candidatus Parvibacillus calidus]|jgi:hypothetical protein|nr:MAG: hypothetical protein UZ08_BCD001001366 [Candidatus Parvibacillus calidus]
MESATGRNEGAQWTDYFYCFLNMWIVTKQSIQSLKDEDADQRQKHLPLK